jgi:hypothetical protein
MLSKTIKAIRLIKPQGMYRSFCAAAAFGRLNSSRSTDGSFEVARSVNGFEDKSKDVLESMNP